MKIQVCVGSSCHLRGSSAVITAFQEALKQRQFDENLLEIGGCFCQEHCQEGVVVRVNDTLYTNVTPDMVDALLEGGGQQDE